MKIENLERIMKLGDRRRNVLSDIKRLKVKLSELNKCNKVNFMDDLNVYRVVCGNEENDKLVEVMSYEYNNSNFNKEICEFVINYFKNGIDNKIKELENELVNIDNELNSL